MSKVTYRFLQGVKQEVHKEHREITSAHRNETSGQRSEVSEMFSNDLYNTSNEQESTVESTFTNNEFNLSGFDDSLYTNSTEEEPASTENFEDNLYTQQEQQDIERKNTDEFIQYNIDFDSKVSAKEARTSIESRLPFIVDKADFKSFSDQKVSNRNKKSAVIRETDSIYKLQTKMRKSGLTSEYKAATPERIGFIDVTKTPQLDKNFNSNSKSTRSKSKTKQLDKIVGILNERFIIQKKKGFNKKKLGYLPVELAEIQTLESFDNITEEEINSSEKHSKSENEKAYYDRLYTQKKLLEHEQEREQAGGVQRYVEIVEDRGIGRFIFIVALIIVIWFTANAIKNSSLADGWSRNGLNLIKTEEQTIETETNIELSMNATPTLKENELNINLTSVKVDEITFTVELIDDETGIVIHESEELPSGASIDTIFIENSLYENNTDENLYRQALVRCETFKSGKYLGEVEQNIEIKIKPINAE